MVLGIELNFLNVCMFPLKLFVFNFMESERAQLKFVNGTKRIPNRNLIDKIIVFLYWNGMYLGMENVHLKWVFPMTDAKETYRILTPSFQTLALQRRGPWVTRPMFQHEWWGHMDMLLLNMLWLVSCSVIVVLRNTNEGFEIFSCCPIEGNE